MNDEKTISVREFERMWMNRFAEDLPHVHFHKTRFLAVGNTVFYLCDDWTAAKAAVNSGILL